MGQEAGCDSRVVGPLLRAAMKISARAGISSGGQGFLPSSRGC